MSKKVKKNELESMNIKSEEKLFNSLDQEEPKEPAKKKKTGIVVGSVVGVVLLAGIIFIILWATGVIVL